MANKNIIQNLSRSHALWIVGLLLYLLGTIFSALLQPLDGNSLQHSEALSPFWEFLREQIPGKLWPTLLQSILLLASALLFQIIVRKYELLRTLGVFTFFIYCIVAATSVHLHYLIPGAFASFFIALAYISVFESYRKEDCNTQVFNASFLIVLASLFVPPLLFLFPLYWVVFNIVNTMNFKRWLVSLMGGLTVFWILGSLLFLRGHWQLLPDFFKAAIQIDGFFPIALNPLSLIFFFMLVFILSLSAFHYLKQIYVEKIAVRAALSFLLVSWLIFMAFLFLFPAYRADFFLLVLGPFSVLVSHFYSSKVNRFGRIVLYLFLLSAVGNYFSIFF